MKKLTYSFLFLMLLTSVPALADYAPVNVQTALKKMYPAAKDVAWSRDETYYVADFIQNGFDTKVWFNSEAQWEMKQIDWGKWMRCPMPYTMLLPQANIPTEWCRESP
jgi:hypothetical protein